MQRPDDLAIPQFLKRTTEPVMTQTTAKKRTRAELPTTLSDGDVIADLSLSELVEKKAVWEAAIASHGCQQLELRAINAAIRAKAK
jgi:hypothetical protein